MQIKNSLTSLLNIQFPILMAPMFLVSNVQMLQKGIENGIAACIPSLNFITSKELEIALDSLNKLLLENKNKGTYAVNLIIQHPRYDADLEICVNKKVPLIITSLGNPKNVVEKVHSYGGKVFCDVTNLKHAQKAYDAGCDGFIAVGQGAGGHAGPYSLQVLVPSLKEVFKDFPVISAGGIATGRGILSMFALGADGVSIGTRFIASTEANISAEYKQSIVDSTMEDIVMTKYLSGTPSSIINTEYAKTLIAKSEIEDKAQMLKNGINELKSSIKSGNYNNLWVAGQSVSLINEIKSCDEIINDLKKELEQSYQVFKNLFINNN